MNKLAKYLTLAIVLTGLTGCAGTVIDTTTDAALALAKTPFKVAGAVVDVVSDDDDDD
tara:strand:- start:320 stop:493 length:174 start_codon:yes stop_codon:yes gene_type:complete